MFGKLITTYVSNIRNIEKEEFFVDAIKLFVARGTRPMESLTGKGFKQVLALAPNEELLTIYKNGSISWQEYVMIFRKCMTQSKKTSDVLDLVKERLTEGKTVILCCYEKDSKMCHRYIESNYFSELGFECYEYQSDKANKK